MASRVQVECGFSLLELMIVLTIIGLVAGFSVPTIVRFTESSRLAGAMHLLVDDIRFARSLATSQRRTYVLRRSGTTYAVACVSPSATVLRRELPRNVSFTAVDSTRFFAWGLTQPASITLRQRDQTRLVTLGAGGQVLHD
jgi:prepilin-type N-terminal cleavage/methylation domain-containing protein